MGNDATTECPACGGETSVRPVPADCRQVIAEAPAAVRLCHDCLHVAPAPGRTVDSAWEPGDVTTALPNDPDAALAVALLVGLLESLALNRDEILTVVESLEREGVDPLLAVDRLADDPRVSPAVDLARRRDQLAQVMGR